MKLAASTPGGGSYLVVGDDTDIADLADKTVPGRVLETTEEGPNVLHQPQDVRIIGKFKPYMTPDNLDDDADLKSLLNDVEARGPPANALTPVAEEFQLG
jgi:hypothetical protein